MGEEFISNTTAVRGAVGSLFDKKAQKHLNQLIKSIHNAD